MEFASEIAFLFNYKLVEKKLKRGYLYEAIYSFIKSDPSIQENIVQSLVLRKKHEARLKRETKEDPRNGY